MTCVPTAFHCFMTYLPNWMAQTKTSTTPQSPSFTSFLSRTAEKEEKVEDEVEKAVEKSSTAGVLSA